MPQETCASGLAFILSAQLKLLPCSLIKEAPRTVLLQTCIQRTPAYQDPIMQELGAALEYWAAGGVLRLEEPEHHI